MLYDYSSVMHYSSNTFSKNNMPTIIPKDETAEIGERKELSNSDYRKINNMYCPSTCGVTIRNLETNLVS